MQNNHKNFHPCRNGILDYNFFIVMPKKKLFSKRFSLKLSSQIFKKMLPSTAVVTRALPL